MTSVSPKIYTDNFEIIYKWFKENTHPDTYDYSIIDLPNTHLKMVDVCSAISNICFRVILDASYGTDIKKDFVLPKTGIDKKRFAINPKDTNYSYQKCFVILDKANKPIADRLFSLEDISDMDYRLVS